MRSRLLCWLYLCLGTALLAEQGGATCNLKLVATVPSLQPVAVEVRPSASRFEMEPEHYRVFENRIIVKIYYNLYKPVKIYLLSQDGKIRKRGRYAFYSVGKEGSVLPYRLRVHGSKRYVPSSGEVWEVSPYPKEPLVGHSIGLDVVIPTAYIGALKAGEYRSGLTVCIVEEQ